MWRPVKSNNGQLCQNAPGVNELRPIYKVEKCLQFHSVGFCEYGTTCQFVHDPENAFIYNREMHVMWARNAIGQPMPLCPPTVSQADSDHELPTGPDSTTNYPPHRFTFGWRTIVLTPIHDALDSQILYQLSSSTLQL